MICEAAARLFRDKGYKSTSMRDLAREVRLKASSLYNHIQSKEEILQEICFDNARRFLEGMTEVEKLEASAADKIRALIRLHICIATNDVTSVTAFNDEWRHLSEPHLSEFKALRREYEQRFRLIIEEGVRLGELKPLHSTVALYTIFSSVRFMIGSAPAKASLPMMWNAISSACSWKEWKPINSETHIWEKYSPQFGPDFSGSLASLRPGPHRIPCQRYPSR